MLVAILISIISILPQERDSLLPPATVIAIKESVPLDKIPSPVSVIGAEMLSTVGTYRPNGLSGIVPNLHIPEYGASLTSTIYLRGMGSRMENPVMGLYLDGIPVLDKNAYDFDWAGIRSATMLRGPQGTLYGRNAMGGVLSLRSLSASDIAGPFLNLEYGSATSLRASAIVPMGNSIFSASYRHTDGFFLNEYKNENCDSYDGISVRLKWQKDSESGLNFCNALWTSLSKEGGFAYGQWKDSKLLPVSYNDEGSYGRISVIDGFTARWTDNYYIADIATSFQLLADDMHMDQDYTYDSVFTLQQKQLSGAGTLEARFRRSNPSASWQPQTGIFGMYKMNHIAAPVTFRHDGIQRLILDNANSHIPSEIGYLTIPDSEFPVNSDFLIGSWNIALFHESVYSAGNWQFTAGIRLDYEGSRMDYDCLASMHYRFIPTMTADKPFQVPYRGSCNHSVFEVLPKISALYMASETISVYTTLSKGYRAGGFNTQIFSDILQNETMNAMMKDLGVHLDRPVVSVSAENTEYDPETAWNCELGSRYRKGDIKTELSAFYLSIRNQQLTIFPPGLSTGRMMTNIGRSRSIGAEAELDWTPDNYRFHLAWAWCDAKDRSGKKLPYIPLHTLFASAGYGFQFEGCRLDIDFAAKGNGPVWWDEDNTLRESFCLRLDSRIALAFPKWEAYIRGENLANMRARCFYFKSMGNEFFAAVKPRIILLGISIKISTI